MKCNLCLNSVSVICWGCGLIIFHSVVTASEMPSVSDEMSKQIWYRWNFRINFRELWRKRRVWFCALVLCKQFLLQNKMWIKLPSGSLNVVIIYRIITVSIVLEGISIHFMLNVQVLTSWSQSYLVLSTFHCCFCQWKTLQVCIFYDILQKRHYNFTVLILRGKSKIWFQSTSSMKQYLMKQWTIGTVHASKWRYFVFPQDSGTVHMNSLWH